MEELHANGYIETKMRYVIKDVGRSVLLVREYFVDLCKGNKLALALYDPWNIYEGIIERSLRTFDYNKTPFSLAFVSKDEPRRVICEKAGKNSDHFLYFSLENFTPLGIETNGRYRCRLPFVLSSAPASFTQDRCRFFGIQISVYLYPERYDAMTVTYNIGIYEVSLDSTNRVDIRRRQFMNTIFALLGLKKYIPLSYYYQSHFHSKRSFTLGEETEGCVEDCIRELLDEISREE